MEGNKVQDLQVCTINREQTFYKQLDTLYFLYIYPCIFKLYPITFCLGYIQPSYIQSHFKYSHSMYIQLHPITFLVAMHVAVHSRNVWCNQHINCPFLGTFHVLVHLISGIQKCSIDQRGTVIYLLGYPCKETEEGLSDHQHIKRTWRIFV